MVNALFDKVNVEAEYYAILKIRAELLETLRYMNG